MKNQEERSTPRTCGNCGKELTNEELKESLNAPDKLGHHYCSDHL